MSELLRYARPYTRVILVALLVGMAASVAGLVQPLVAKAVIDALGRGEGLLALVAGLTALVVLGAVLEAGSGVLLGRTAEQIVRDVRGTLAWQLIRLRLPELDRSAPGDLISRATADSAMLREAATSALVNLVTGVVGLIGALLLMSTLSLPLLLISVLVLALVAVLLGLVLPRLRQAMKAAQTAIGRLGSALDRALGAARTVKASGAEHRETDAVRAAVDEAYRAGLRGVRLQAGVQAISTLAVQVPFLVVLGTGGMLVARGQIPVSTLVAFLLYLFYLVGPIGQLVGGVSTLQQGLGAVDRIRGVAALQIEDDVDPPAPDPPAADPPGTTLPTGHAAHGHDGHGHDSHDSHDGHGHGHDGHGHVGHGHVGHGHGHDGHGDDEAMPVRFERVTFAYPGRPRVLADVSFEVPSPGLTALVGPSGAGKSTLFALLMRFYEPDSGRILLDGTPITSMTRADVRRLIGYVEQDAPALSGTLAENLRYGTADLADRGDDEQVAAVLAATRLDELVHRLPEGEQTLVGTRGVLLSGGERQRVAIARALLRRPRVLLLDEATSQLDARNEQALRDTVQVVSEERTVLVVAHRLSTVTAADRIVVLDAGRVRAVGTHAELVRTDTLYAELAATQLLAADPVLTPSRPTPPAS